MSKGLSRLRFDRNLEVLNARNEQLTNAGRRNIDCFCEMDKSTFVPLCRLQAVLNARLNGDSLPLTDIDGDEIHMPKLVSLHMQDRLDVMWAAYGRGQPTLGQTATEHIRRRELGEDFTRRIQCSTCYIKLQR